MLYQDKYVAFIDMLGFSALVQESAADMSKLPAPLRCPADRGADGVAGRTAPGRDP